MDITYVTAFILQTKDKDNSEKKEEYIKRFQYLLKLKINILLFLDRSVIIENLPDNISVINTDLSESIIYKEYSDIEIKLPEIRNEPKDTIDYMFIQNSKLEFIYKATQLNPFSSTHFAWIDFGISHVISEPEKTLSLLENLRPNNTQLLFAAIHTPPANIPLNKICWRFAGGFFLVNADTAKDLFELYCKVIKEIKPQLSWEVNIWAYIENKYAYPFNVYYANHNDTIITNILKANTVEWTPPNI
jgi:hypothetical protein